jgi:hypothetical protein
MASLSPCEAAEMGATPETVVTNDVAVAFAGYLRDLVAPLGEAMLGATVVTLDTGPGYNCRDVDRVSGA